MMPGAGGFGSNPMMVGGGFGNTGGQLFNQQPQVVSGVIGNQWGGGGGWQGAGQLTSPQWGGGAPANQMVSGFQQQPQMNFAAQAPMQSMAGGVGTGFASGSQQMGFAGQGQFGGGVQWGTGAPSASVAGGWASGFSQPSSSGFVQPQKSSNNGWGGVAGGGSNWGVSGGGMPAQVTTTSSAMEANPFAVS